MGEVFQFFAASPMGEEGPFEINKVKKKKRGRMKIQEFRLVKKH